jgi:hypothetical protein
MESYLIIILIAIVIIYKYLNSLDVVYVEFFDSNNNKKKYLVRDVEDKEYAVKTLLFIENALRQLIDMILKENNMDDDMQRYVMNIKDKINDVEIQESSSDSLYTSYSVNKGEILVLCLRSKKTGEIHDTNDLLYVAIHEIAHIGCPEIGHTDLFYKINRFLIKKAMQYNIYKYVNYNINNRDYCGMNLTINVADN